MATFLASLPVLGRFYILAWALALARSCTLVLGCCGIPVLAPKKVTTFTKSAPRLVILWQIWQLLKLFGCENIYFFDFSIWLVFYTTLVLYISFKISYNFIHSLDDRAFQPVHFRDYPPFYLLFPLAIQSSHMAT